MDNYSKNFYILCMLGIEQKKGNDKRLCGRMIAYARILPSPDVERSSTPFDDMVKNGILALEGDFRQQPVLPNKRSSTTSSRPCAKKAWTCPKMST